MPSLRWIRALAFAVALPAASACDTGLADPLTDFPFASASPECGPADGPAVTIDLVQDTMPTLPPRGPRVRAYLWHTLPELTGRSWSVGGNSPDGAADYWDSAGTITALRGTVTVTTVLADSIVAGEVDLVSAGTFRVRGGFRARWIPRTPLCG